MTDIKTWQERMPKRRIAYQCDMNCSPRSEGKDCGDCTPVWVYGDPVAARDAEIADLRASIERLNAQAKRYLWLRDKSEPGICAFYLSVGQAFKGVKFAPETVDEAIDAALKKET